MTFRERAEKLLQEHPIQYAVGSKHHWPEKAAQVVADAILAAQVEAMEECARIADKSAWRYGGGFFVNEGAKQASSEIADDIRARAEEVRAGR